MTTQIDTTNQRIDQLNQNLEKQLSFKRSFAMAVVYGAGYAIGASLIAGLIIATLNWTIHSVQDIPVVGKLIGNSDLSL